MVDFLKLALPFIYLGVLVGALSTFSSLYRRRKAYRAHALAPWFPDHKSRDFYLSLLHTDDTTADGKPVVPDSLLKAALLRRAQEDVQRVVQLRNTKPALQALLQRGSIGDDLWTRFTRAEQELEIEVREVMEEATAFQEGWGPFIFQSANEIVQNQVIRDRISEVQSTMEAEHDWWEKRRSEVQKNFMAELDQESNASTGGSKSEHTGSSVAGSRASDDEVVLVETPKEGGGGGKKKKGKK